MTDWLASRTQRASSDWPPNYPGDVFAKVGDFGKLVACKILMMCPRGSAGGIG